VTRAGVVGALSMVFAVVGNTPASATSLRLTPSTSSPQQGQTVSLTEDGTTEQSSAMNTYFELGASSCAPTAGDESARVNSRSIDLRFPDPGSFSYVGQFVTDDPGTYLICGYVSYLGDPDQAPPRATASASVTVPLPPTVSVVVRPSNAQRVYEIGGHAAVDTTADPHVESATYFAIVEPGGVSCAPTPTEEMDRPNAVGIGASHFLDPNTPSTHTDLYLIKALGHHLVCGYLRENSEPHRTAVAATAFEVLAKPSRLSLTPDLARHEVITAGRGFLVLVIAETGYPARLTIYSDTHRRCAPSAGVESSRRAARLQSSRRISERAIYDKLVKLKKPGTYRLCGYITQSTGAVRTLAKASRLVVVHRRKTR
jgi:hypothetical protein